ncbi:hypothetical protein [Mesorhizobium sp. 10J20-29]
MARPGELAQLIADEFLLDPKTVREQARALRDAGYMAKEKGGRGPGTMSVRDATNLLIAVAGTGKVRDSVLPVEQHGNTETQQGKWTGVSTLPELSKLPRNHKFADAIEALIRSAMNGALESPLSVSVKLHEPIARSSISITRRTVDEEGSLQEEPIEEKLYETQISPRPGISFDPPLAARPESGLWHEHMFTAGVIRRIADLMRS